MLTDRYGLAVPTASPEARDAYVEGCDLLLTAYPGALAALDRAIDADPGFAAAYVAKGRVQQLGGDIASARASLAEAEMRADGLPARLGSQIEIFRRMFAGQSADALIAVRAHLDEWPRDAMVLGTTANQGGLIGLSGRAGREQDLTTFLGSLATHYGDDWWFNAHYGMALSETSQQVLARPIIERSLAQHPHNAFAAHARAHLYYEDGARDEAIVFLHGWLPAYSRGGGLYGHLNWHLALFELQRGNVAEGFRLYTEAFALDDYPASAILKVVDATSFLWRSELAGHPRDPERWRAIHDFAHKMFPQAGLPMVDWHIALADAATGDDAALEARVQEMDALLHAGRFPYGPAVPALARAFAALQRQNFAAAIEAIEPVLPQRERICGSRAQVDLVEFTLLNAYLRAGRPDDAGRLVSARRPGPTAIPVAGMVVEH
jgi:tetratricopeptide (TPR) repeat protein